jgi:hypothetical protein
MLARLLPRNLSVLTAVLRPIIQCSEYSLAICCSVLLSFAAHAVLGIGWNNLATQTLVRVAGIAMLSRIAASLAI